MKNTTGKRTEEEMRQRIQQLQNQLDELSGGTAMFGHMPTDDEHLEQSLQFLEHVLCFEMAADTTWKKLMEEEGILMPAPDTLSDEELSSELWVVLQTLANLNCVLDYTNHLSDRELYQKLYTVLEEPTEDMRDMGLKMTCHLEMLHPGVEEDDLIWLKYFADEDIRQRWQQDFGITLPPKEDPPYDRDRFLPQNVQIKPQ